jgi:hypothetical protein
MTQSFKLTPAAQTGDTVIGKLIRWIFYAIAFAFLLWPALIIVGIVIAVGLALLAITVGLSIVLLPVAILFRVLRLV